MALQSGTYTITGTISNLCFYEMEGKHYVRRKSSLTGKRVKTDGAFAQTMRFANLLGKASKIASGFYKTIPKPDRVKGLYRQLTGMVIQLLKEGKNEAAIIACLEQYVRPKKANATVKPAISMPLTHRLIYQYPEALLEVIFAKPLCYRQQDNWRNAVPMLLKNYGFV